MTPYGFKPTVTPLFDLRDEIISEIEREENKERKPKSTSGDVFGFGNGDDSYKHIIKNESNSNKEMVITELKKCNYRTPPIFIAELLERYFSDPSTKDGWWLYVAQHWPPRPIVRVINRLIKLRVTGGMSIKNEAACFTFLIKKRKRRKEFIRINDTCKQQNNEN